MQKTAIGVAVLFLICASQAAAAPLAMTVHPNAGSYDLQAAEPGAGSLTAARLGLDVDGKTLWAGSARKVTFSGEASGKVAPGQSVMACYEFETPRLDWSVEFQLSSDGATALDCLRDPQPGREPGETRQVPVVGHGRQSPWTVLGRPARANRDACLVGLGASEPRPQSLRRQGCVDEQDIRPALQRQGSSERLSRIPYVRSRQYRDSGGVVTEIQADRASRLLRFNVASTCRNSSFSMPSNIAPRN